MDNFRTCDSVLSYLETCVREKRPISPHEWIQAAEYLNILRSDEQEKLFNLEQLVAQARVQCAQDGHNGVTTKAIVEASDAFKAARTQKAKLDRINEAILLAKKHATLADWK